MPRTRTTDTVSRRIARVAAGVFVVLLGVGAVATVALVRSADTVARLSTGYAPANDDNNAALIYMLDAETGIRGYALNGRQAALAPFRTAVRRVIPTLDEVSAALTGIGDDSLEDHIADERRRATTWIATVARPAARTAAAARRIAQSTSARTRFDAFRAANARVSAALRTSRARLQHDSDRQRTVVLPILIAGTVVVLALCGLVALLTARSVSRPLADAWRVLRRLRSGESGVRADETSGPAEVRELSAAVNSLALERELAIAAQHTDDELRRATRDLTSAIRIGHDPQTVAATLVAGLAKVFGVDHVWLWTFPDARVPVLADHWGEKGADALAGVDPERLRDPANRLWHGASVIGVPALPGDPSGVDAEVTDLPPAAVVRSSLLAAVGEGSAAMGLLWLGSADAARRWRPIEIGLLEHVAAELAQNLVQSHVFVQQREAMRQLREADEAKTALVSTVSHELRTPLTSIMGYLDLVLETDPAHLPPGMAEMLRVIERNAARLRALIDDLLTQSEIEAGKRMVDLRLVDLATVAREAVEALVPIAHSADLELALTEPGGPLTVEGDARQIGQALTNLIANAVKFTPAGGRVGVDVAASESGAVVTVTDTGIGIPPEELPHLFDPFFRASNARDAVIPGTGLGLGIVAEIIAQHHGKVEVDSRLGTGTTFEIHLPIASETPARDAAPPDRAGTVEDG